MGLKKESLQLLKEENKTDRNERTPLKTLSNISQFFSQAFRGSLPFQRHLNFKKIIKSFFCPARKANSSVSFNLSTIKFLNLLVVSP